MNLIGSRSTLVANVCALVVASVVVAEGAYIVLVYHARPSAGNYLTHDAWVYFIPALVMFIIRTRIFSWFFLVLYIALSIRMFFQARSLYLGTYRVPVWADPLGFLPWFFLLSMGCLAFYAAVALVRFVASQFDSRQ
jgi:hypothetical protein